MSILASVESLERSQALCWATLGVLFYFPQGLMVALSPVLIFSSSLRVQDNLFSIFFDRIQLQENRKVRINPC